MRKIAIVTAGVPHTVQSLLTTGRSPKANTGSDLSPEIVQLPVLSKEGDPILAASIRRGAILEASRENGTRSLEEGRCRGLGPKASERDPDPGAGPNTARVARSQRDLALLAVIPALLI